MNTKYSNKISIIIVAVLLVGSFYLGGLQNIRSFATTSIGELNKKGDVVSRSATDGQDWTLNIKQDATYTVKLWGPGGKGSGAGKGGYVETAVNLVEGDVINIYLGPQSTDRDGTRNGAKGTDGSGHGDGGIYKAQVSIFSKEIVTAGGGGSKGNPGRGDNTATISNFSGWTAGPQYRTKGKNDYHYHYDVNGLFFGSGGNGGNGGNGGSSENTTGVVGNTGSIGSGYLDNFNSVLQSTMTYTDAIEYPSGIHYSPWYKVAWTTGATGGAGGDGGASFVSPQETVADKTTITPGLNVGVSKIEITMGDIAKPAGGGVDNRKELKEIALAIREFDGDVPVITVVAGEQFNVIVGKYDDMLTGTVNGITADNTISGDGIVQLKGKIDTVGKKTLTINNKQFAINIVAEPNSSNVSAVLN